MGGVKRGGLVSPCLRSEFSGCDGDGGGGASDPTAHWRSRRLRGLYEASAWSYDWEMSIRGFNVIVGLPLLALCVAEGAEAEVDEAVQRSLSYLEEEGAWWIAKKECVSCHHTTFLVWAKDLAAEAGFEVDPVVLDEQRKWMVEQFLSPVEVDADAEEKKDPDERKGDRNVEGVSQFLVSPSARFFSDGEREALLELVARNQGDDGNWSPDGQLPRQQRPQLETTWVSNQWADAALRGTSREPENQIVTWKVGTPAKTTEWYAMNLIGYPNGKSIEQLLRRQNEDGGWSWMPGEGSDPLSTGQALFALARSEVARGHPEVIRRAHRFLVATQAEDGRWETMSTKDRSESTRVSDFWGSAWAVIGLLETRGLLETQIGEDGPKD